MEFSLEQMDFEDCTERESLHLSFVANLLSASQAMFFFSSAVLVDGREFSKRSMDCQPVSIATTSPGKR